MVICLERGADLYMAQLMPLPLTISCSSKIQIGFTFVVPAHLGSPRKRAIKCVCVCVCVFLSHLYSVTPEMRDNQHVLGNTACYQLLFNVCSRFYDVESSCYLCLL